MTVAEKKQKQEQPKASDPGTALDVIGKKKGALEKLADRLDLTVESVTQVLKATAFKECTTDAQFVAAVVVANTYGLNPLLREMTAFPGKQGGVVPVVMVDGWINLVNKHPKFDGVKITENENPDGRTNKSGTMLDSVTVEFFLKGCEHPVVITEYMDECFEGSKGPWVKWPRRMLRHKAYIQGARVAFGFSGIYDEDEKERILSGQITEVIETPIVGLKHDKEKSGTMKEAEIVPPQEQAKTDEAPAEVKGVGEYYEVGIVAQKDAAPDYSRFGEDAPKIKNMAANIKKCADKLGMNRFLTILGNQGFEKVTQLNTIQEVAAFLNALLAG